MSRITSTFRKIRMNKYLQCSIVAVALPVVYWTVAAILTDPFYFTFLSLLFVFGFASGPSKKST